MGSLFAGARFSRALLADVSAGSLCAFVGVTYAVSYAALIFSGPELAPYLALGVQSALLASALLALVVAIGSSYAIAIAGVDSNLVAVLAVMIPGLAAALVAGRATPDELVADKTRISIESSESVALPTSWPGSSGACPATRPSAAPRSISKLGQPHVQRHLVRFADPGRDLRLHASADLPP